MLDTPLQHCVDMDQRVCSNYRGIKLLGLPGKVYSRVLKRRVWGFIDHPIQEERAIFVLAMEHWTNSIPT